MGSLGCLDVRVLGFQGVGCLGFRLGRLGVRVQDVAFRLYGLGRRVECLR